MSNEIKLGDIVVFKTGNRAFEVIGKYIVPDDRLWRVDAITENEPPTTDRNRKYRLVAVDCPNVMLDEIPERYVESYSEKLEREFEEQRKEALKMNRNEIKQGDKVRVSENAPEMFRCGFNHVYTAYISKVLEIDDGNAIIEMTMANMQCQERIIIPTKYLVKVDAEAEEAKFKRGYKVRYVGDMQPTCKGKVFVMDGEVFFNDYYNQWQTRSIKPFMWDGMSVCNVPLHDLEPYAVPTTPAIKPGDKVRIKSNGRIVTVVGIGDRSGDIYFDVDGERRWVRSDEAELIDKPTEEKNLQDATASELRDLANHGVAVGDEVKRRIKEREEKPNVGSIKIPVEIDLTDSYWDAYAAELAKEVALKIANKFNSPNEAAEYAVSVAKAVVEGLKRK